MAELGEGLSGYLDVQDATLRAPRLEAVSNIGIANTAPQHAFSVGSNLYVDTESSNVLTVDGNVVCEGVKVGLIEIVPSYDLAAVSNVGNVTQSTIQFSNATTGFVTTANATIGNILTVEGNASINGNLSVTSNLEVGTANLFVDTTTSRVGVNTATPDASLHVTGNAYVSSNLEVGTANLFVDTVSGRVGIGTTDPDKKLHVYTTDTESNSQLFLQSANRYATMQMSDDSGGVMVQNDQGDLRLLTGFDASMANGSETMRIKDNGNVGIGVVDPGLFKLNVNGTAHLPSIHRTNFTKELSEYFELVSGTTSTVTLNSLLVEINVTGTSDVDMSEYAGTIDLDILAQRTNQNYGEDVVKTQLHFTAAWNEQNDQWERLQFIQEIKAQDINSYRCITSVPVFRFTYIARKLQIYIQYNALQYRVKHSFTARVSSDEAFAGDIISYPGGAPMSGTDAGAVQGLCYGIGGKLGVGTNSPIAAFNVKQSADNSPAGSFIISPVSGSLNYWGMYVSAGNDFMFHQNGSDRGALVSGVNVSAIDFTGQHRNFIDGIPATNYVDFEGLIVSANKNKYFDVNEDLTTGANAIQISQSLPLVALSNVALDKACFGVISGVEDPDTRTYEQGTFVTILQKQTGDRRAFINSVGEGAIWVTNINGPLESGDYITTSNVAGYGQKQESDSLKNYTVAKITMDCDFNPATQSLEIIRKEMGDVNYWVNTTYENVSEEEYSNLAEENRQIVDGVYQKITKEESKTEQEGYELEVRQELVNVLDEHGEIQWEDHPTETEKAYKIRYLDADGNITDEANAVHKAAFVGCTYHCG